MWPEIPEETIPYGDGTPSAPTERSVNNLATVAATGSSPVLGKTKEEIADDLARGNETQLRAATAAGVDRNKLEYKQQLIAKTAEAMGGKIPMEIYDQLMDTDLNKLTDPNITFEQNYAQWFIHQMDAHREKMGIKVPTETELDQFQLQKKKEAENIGIKLGTTVKLIDTYADRIRDAYDKQSYIGFAADLGKQIIPGYNEASLRGNVPGADFFQLLGSNMEQQRQIFLTMQPEQQEKVLATAYKYYSENNPSQGVAFFEALKGQAAGDKALNNAFSFIDIAGLAGTIKGITKFSTGTAKAAVEYNAARKTIKNAVEEIAKSEDPPPVAVATAAGDLRSAAIEKAANTLKETISPPAVGEKNFTQRLMDYIPSAFRVDRDIFAADTKSSLSAQNHAIIVDDFTKAADSAVDVHGTKSIVSRVPLQNITKDDLEKHFDLAREKLRGIKNAILDVSSPWVSRITNTIHYDINIGDLKGQLFNSIDEAKEFAKLHKINGDIFEGEGTVTKTKIYDNVGDTVTDDEAMRWADDGGPVRREPTEAQVTQQGHGYYIKVTKGIDEREDVWRDLYVRTAKDRSIIASEGTDKWVKGFFAYVRSSEDTLSPVESALRKVATYSPSRFFGEFNREAKFVLDVMDGTRRVDEVGNAIPAWKRMLGTTVGKTVERVKNTRKFEELKRALAYAQDATDPATGEIGYWFKTPSELDEFYVQNFKRTPDFAEHRAYFATVRAYEQERLIRNFAEYRFKSRVGAETHTIGITDAEGKLVRSQAFDGVVRSHLPSADEDIVIIGENGKNKVVSADKISTKDRKNYEQNYKVIELYSPTERPLQGFNGISNDRIKYVLAKDVESNPLSINQVNRRFGGHFDYDYSHYIKQPNVYFNKKGKAFYEGDNTLMPIDNSIMGKDVADKFNEIRRLIKDDKLAEAEALAPKTGVKWDEIKKWFLGSTVDGKRVPPRFNLDEDFVTVPRNGNIFDYNKELEGKYGKDFRDKTKSGSLADLYKTEFTQRRDASRLYTLTNDGSVDNPAYNYQPAKLIDPLTMLNRGMSRIAHSSVMDDYKIYAVEHWLKEAEKHLDVRPEELRAAPNYYFNNRKYIPGTDQATQNLLEANHMKISQFIGTPDKFDAFVQGATQHLVDMAYANKDNKGTRAVTVLSSQALSRVTDPVVFMRSMAFHANLGLFNIPQFFVQAQGFTNILAISPTRAVPAMQATLLHTWAKVNRNPAVLDHMDNLASKFSIPGFSKWKTGEFKEAMQELDRSGFAHVGSEYMVKDDIYGKKFTQGDISRFLDFGTTFFRKGEESVRLGSWYTAFKEWRDANPLKKITDLDRTEILQRADLLNNNMSRASATGFLDKKFGGVLTLPAQFLTYQMRLGELFWGTRLGNNTPERMMARARLVAFNAALYGIPMSVGVSGLPFADTIRDAMRDKFNYIPGEKELSTFAMEGTPAALTALVTGGGDIQKGMVPNVGSSYGIQGWTQIRDALSSDRPFLEFVGGASGTMLGRSMGNLFGDPYRKMMASINGEEPYPIAVQDYLIKNLSEIKSVSAGAKLLAAWNTGQIISKNGNYEDNTTKGQALFSAITRLQDVRIDDAYRQIKSGAAQEELWTSAQRQFIPLYRKALQNAQDNPKQSEEYRMQAYGILKQAGVPPEEWGKMQSIATRGMESMVLREIFKPTEIDRIPGTKKIMGITVDTNPHRSALERAGREYELYKKRNQ